MLYPILRTLHIKPDLSRQGQSQEFGICTFFLWILDFFLWTEDDSGLPNGPLTITKTLKHFFDNVLLEHVELIRVLPLVTFTLWVLLFETSFMLKSYVLDVGP